MMYKHSSSVYQQNAIVNRFGEDERIASNEAPLNV